MALACGVSVATVSRVVRDHPDVRAETRERVRQIIQDMGYRPSPAARALVSGRQWAIGLLVSDIANPFYPQLAKSVERETRKFGCVVVMCSTEDDVREAKRSTQRLLEQGVEGIIHASAGNDEEAVLALVGNPNRIVFANRRPRTPGCNYVVSDNVAGAAELTRHLLAAGHRRIGFINGPSYASNAVERLQGFITALEDVPDAEPVVIEGGMTYESGLRAAETWLRVPGRPTAIIGANDSIALGAMEAILKAGLSVPGDIAVAGFDDIQLASSYVISLTSVAQHIDQMARRSVRILMGMLEDPTRKKVVQEVIQPTLLVRRSTSAPALAAPPRTLIRA
ncbi:LacI family transcriptional regulator [bacterium]|nr:MAG: LacI family transcriptional regulator [bacterium]